MKTTAPSSTPSSDTLICGECGCDLDERTETRPAGDALPARTVVIFSCPNCRLRLVVGTPDQVALPHAAEP